MVVVAARAEERRLIAELRHQSEADDVAVERVRITHVADGQVHVAHHRAARESVERLGQRVLENGEQIVRVERQRGQPPADLPLPELARAVGVDLDPVVVGIGQVDRLADVMGRQTCERHALARGIREPAGEIDALGDEEREMEETRIPVRGPRAGLPGEHDQVLAPGPEPRTSVVTIVHDETDLRLVVGDRAVEIGHREMDCTHARVGRQLSTYRRADCGQLLGIHGPDDRDDCEPYGARSAGKASV